MFVSHAVEFPMKPGLLGPWPWRSCKGSHCWPEGRVPAILEVLARFLWNTDIVLIDTYTHSHIDVCIYVSMSIHIGIYIYIYETRTYIYGDNFIHTQIHTYMQFHVLAKAQTAKGRQRCS